MCSFPAVHLIETVRKKTTNLTGKLLCCCFRSWILLFKRIRIKLEYIRNSFSLMKFPNVLGRNHIFFSFENEWCHMQDKWWQIYESIVRIYMPLHIKVFYEVVWKRTEIILCGFSRLLKQQQQTKIKTSTKGQRRNIVFNYKRNG